MSNEERIVFAHCRERQAEGREIDHHVARTIAAWWHSSGNDSAALSTTGAIPEGLRLYDFHGGEYDRQSPDNRLALDMLGTYMVARQVAGDTGPVAGWSDMWADRPAAASQSGYTHCACRDCMDTTVSSNASKPELCSECKDAGCEPWKTSDTPTESWYGTTYECQREDAYSDAVGDAGAGHDASEYHSGA